MMPTLHKRLINFLSYCENHRYFQGSVLLAFQLQPDYINFFVLDIAFRAVSNFPSALKKVHQSSKILSRTINMPTRLNICAYVEAEKPSLIQAI